jgi:hypothetical protein
MFTHKTRDFQGKNLAFIFDHLQGNLITEKKNKGGKEQFRSI